MFGQSSTKGGLALLAEGGPELFTESFTGPYLSLPQHGAAHRRWPLARWMRKRRDGAVAPSSEEGQ